MDGRQVTLSPSPDDTKAKNVGTINKLAVEFTKQMITALDSLKKEEVEAYTN